MFFGSRVGVNHVAGHCLVNLANFNYKTLNAFVWKSMRLVFSSVYERVNIVG